MYRVILQSRAERQFKKIAAKDQKKIAEAIDALAKDPFVGKKLEGKLQHYYGVRVWPYRIIYMIEKKILTVYVIGIGQRKDVYRNM